MVQKKKGVIQLLEGVQEVHLSTMYMTNYLHMLLFREYKTKGRSFNFVIPWSNIWLKIDCLQFQGIHNTIWEKKFREIIFLHHQWPIYFRNLKINFPNNRQSFLPFMFSPRNASFHTLILLILIANCLYYNAIIL